MEAVVISQRSLRKGYHSRRRNSERRVWVRALSRVLARRVLGGPFRGMRYVAESAGSTLMPKVLGTYEKELWGCLAALLELGPRCTVLDIGAGEGYYVTGLVWSGRAARAVAYEADEAARNALALLANRNGVRDRVGIRGRCDAESLAAALRELKPQLLIVDVEGAELELLGPNVIEQLIRTHLVVEIHPWVSLDAGSILRKRFAPTHDIMLISARVPSPADIECTLFRTLASLHPRISKRLLQERPAGMSWLAMRSRAA
jgi:hypothetical protein